MAILNREQIFKAKDIKTETVPVPEWGGEVIVKGLSASQRDAYESGMFTVDKNQNFHFNMDNNKAKLVQMTIVDEEGKPLFEKADIEMLGSKSASALNRVYDVAQELSGLKNGGDIEEKVKN